MSRHLHKALGLVLLGAIIDFRACQLLVAYVEDR